MYRFRRKIIPYIFISPFFIGYAIFFIYPALWSMNLSLHRQDGINAEPRYIGLENYADLLQDERFVQAVINTTQIAVASIFVILPIALGVGMLLSLPNIRFREIFRLLFFSPVITSGVVVGIIFTLVYSEDYGLINNLILKPLGIPPIRWLVDTEWIVPSIVLLIMWRYTGINAIYFMVGLQNIPPELKEAARVDGATRWQVFRHITFPLLRPVLIFVVTFAIIGSYNLFAESSLLVGEDGGPNNAGLTLPMYLYLNAFRFIKLGYAAAIGYALAVIVIGITFVQLMVMRVFRED